MYLLGIDLGTSAVKCLLISPKGEILTSVSESYPLSLPQDGWSEQEPLDWWNGVVAAIKKIGQDFDLREIQGISFSGQMHGLVALDENDKVIRPAILWNDTRTGEQVQYLNETIGREKLIRETGNIAYAGFTAPKILWMQEHEPELFARVAKIMLPKDYLAYRFTGNFVTDYSDASGMLLLDVEHKKWSAFMMEVCKLKPDMLAQLHDSFDPVGTVLPQVAAELGLSEECVIVAGAGDNAAAAIGTGTVGENTCNISLGTSGTIFITSKNFVNLPSSELHSFCHADGSYHVMGVLLAAASANKWWIEDILAGEDYNGALTQSAEQGENKVYFMPYLMGERSPHNDEKVRGAFLGLAMNSTRGDLSLAILEGVTFALRDCLEVAKAQGIHVTSSKVSGGGAKSAVWKQLLANILGIRIQELEIEEGPSLGAAMLAGVGCGAFSSLQEATDLFVKEKSFIEPNPEVVAKYNEKYAKWHSLYPMVKGFY